MPKSLAELRNSPRLGRPEQLHNLCVAGKLNAEIDAINIELEEMLQDHARNLRQGTGQQSSDPDAPTPPPRLAQRPGKVGKLPDRFYELNGRREELREEMREHTVTLLLRAMESGEWRRWVQDNPARDGDKADERAGFNIDALLDVLANDPRRFVVSINGDPYSDDDWTDVVWANAADGDKWRLAAAVRLLHQGGVEIPKSLEP